MPYASQWPGKPWPNSEQNDMIRNLVVAVAFMFGLAGHVAVAGDVVVADGGAYVRSGPGIGYRVVSSLRGGATVHVGRCVSKGRWCRVSTRAGAGWVAFAQLAFPNAGRPGQENYGIEDGADGQPAGGYSKILGIVVDKPGYCYALGQSGNSIIVKCP